jgi:hypothetical protein
MSLRLIGSAPVSKVKLRRSRLGKGVKHIYERWIEKFERSRLGALRDLKKRLEGDDDDKA